MKAVAMLVVMLCSGAALAQSAPPTVGDRPLLQVKPRAKSSQPPSTAARLQACLDIEDGTKGRLDCYDAVITPKPPAGTRKPPAAKAVTDCRLVKEEDERLTCFNGFVERLPKLPAR